MPKLVNHASRFEFLRVASFTLVAEAGVRSLTRARVAQLLGTSLSTVHRSVHPEASLSTLAVQEVDSRRRRCSFGRRRRHPEPGQFLVDLLPTDAQRATELVALRLRVEARPVCPVSTADPIIDDGDLTLAERFSIAERGYVDDSQPAGRARPGDHARPDDDARPDDHAQPDAGARQPDDDASPAGRAGGDPGLATVVRRWDEELDRLVHLGLDELEVSADGHEVEHALTRAVIDGLLQARSFGGLEDEVARRALRWFLDQILTDRSDQAPG